MPSSTRSVRILLTAAEAYPALERAFLAARSEIWASFQVFDLKTRLRSPEARKIGRTWFDLIVHTLNRGVALHIWISDVDPIALPAMHRAATRHLRLFSAAAAVAGPGARLEVERARHPAQIGILSRLALWPWIMKRLGQTADWLNGLTAEHRAAALREMDGVGRHLRRRLDGTVAVRLLSLPRLYPVVHHQKLAVIDRRSLYIGGLDLDELHQDVSTHGPPGEQSWHDVQLMIEGPVVAEAQQHLESFQGAIDRLVSPPKTRRLLRTLSVPRRLNLWHFAPEPLVDELRTAHLVLARRATSFIYLESQYFRDLDLARALGESALREPGLQMILILPAAPDEVGIEAGLGLAARYGAALQSRALQNLREAFGARLFIGSTAKGQRALPDGVGKPQGRRDPPFDAPSNHAHAKVSVFDDKAAIVSSANLNGHGLRWDTEAGVYLARQNDVLELRHRVMAHWLPPDCGAEAYAAATAATAWARLAWRNAANPPAQRHGYLLPHDFAAAEALGRKAPMVPPEFV